MPFPNKNISQKYSTRNTALCGVLIALALIFGYLEHLIPFVLPIPGARIGMANLVTLTGLYFLPPGQVLSILIARILLSGFLFGNLSAILYSMAGGIFSYILMRIAQKRKLFSPLGISILGGVTHNIGQLAVACLVVHSTAPILYLPYLLPAGALSGALIGIPATIICRHYRR